MADSSEMFGAKYWPFFFLSLIFLQLGSSSADTQAGEHTSGCQAVEDVSLFTCPDYYRIFKKKKKKHNHVNIRASVFGSNLNFLP